MNRTHDGCIALDRPRLPAFRPASRDRRNECRKALQREVKELRQANEIPRKMRVRLPVENMTAFIDEHWAAYGVTSKTR